MEQTKKPWWQKEPLWSAILIILIAILSGFGVDLIGDPEQMERIYTVGIALATAFGLYGLKDALIKQKETLNEDDDDESSAGTAVSDYRPPGKA